MRTDSPEDRLLRLIKGKYKKKTDTGKPTRSSGKDAFLTDVSKKIFLKNRIFQPLFSDSVNRILVIILIGLAGYLIYSLVFPVHRNIDYYTEGAEIAPASHADAGREESPSFAAEAKDYSAYAEAIKGKELFTAPLAEEIISGPVVPDIDISARFNLVGIIAGDNPQAIIEDKEAQKTHYLYEGQTINDVTVLKIDEGRVTLGYKGKEVMLVL